MKRIALISVVILALLLTACATNQRVAATEAPMAAAPDYYAAPEEMAAGESMSYASDMVNQPGDGSVPSTTGTSTEQLIVKDAYLTIVVQDVNSSMDRISEMTASIGGYIVSSNVYSSTDQNGNVYKSGSINVRVPVDQLEDAVTQIKGLVGDPNVDVTNESISGQDVTATVVDLESRLENYQLAETQLQEILASTTKTEDWIIVFNQLTATREQIEVLQGQIKYYRETAAMSSINVSLQEKSTAEPLTIAGWQPMGVARDAIQSLLEALQWIGNVLIWLGLYCLPIFILIYVPFRLIFRGAQKKGWTLKWGFIPRPPKQEKKPVSAEDLQQFK